MSKSHLFKVALSDFPLHGKVDVYEEGKAGFTNKLTGRETLATEKFRGLQGWLDLGSQLVESVDFLSTASTFFCDNLF